MFDSKMKHLPIITILYIVFNIVVYFWMSHTSGVNPFSGPSAAQIMQFNHQTLGADPDLIVASMFKTFEHASFQHLVVNSCEILIVGGVIESFLARSMYLLFILVCMLVVGVAVHETTTTLTIGASGIEYGMLTLVLPIMSMEVLIYKKIWLLIPIGLVLLLAGGLLYASFKDSSISAVGHITGMATGYAFGCFVAGLHVDLQKRIANHTGIEPSVAAVQVID
ncbi:MAG: rhomboid family intramembrane serine protease [Lactobacillaceae bacterium]|jgi:membrane associated rhomboid family serine protease|nr:rhomboid family intramembrane serine protease [Lactobacillaceae bacterium]